MDFFQQECCLHAGVPRKDGAEPDGIKAVAVPWARRPGFTLLMEAMIRVLCQTGMTVAQAARVACATPHRLWRVLFPHVEEAHLQMDVSAVTPLTVDETSVRRGQEYVTVVGEPLRPTKDQRTRVLFVAEGKDVGAVTQAAGFRAERGVPAGQFQEVCADRSRACEKGIKESLPEAPLVFDIFHVVGLLRSAVDKVRRRERAQFPEWRKGTRCLGWKNQENLTAEQQEQRHRLCGSKLATAKAHCHRAAFQDLLKARNVDEAISGLKWWYNGVCPSRLPEMIPVAKSLKTHWAGIVAYLKTRPTNAAAEAINGIIPTAKRKSRGFRNFGYFRAVIYLVGSKLKFDLPSPIPNHPLATS